MLQCSANKNACIIVFFMRYLLIVAGTLLMGSLYDLMSQTGLQLNNDFHCQLIR